MMVFPVIICVVRISQWSIHKWEPDEMGTFRTCGTLASLRTNSESAPCLQEQTEEEWRKQKSVWMQQTDQRAAWREVLWCFCIFVCLCRGVFSGKQPCFKKKCKAEEDTPGKEMESKAKARDRQGRWQGAEGQLRSTVCRGCWRQWEASRRTEVFLTHLASFFTWISILTNLLEQFGV